VPSVWRRSGRRAHPRCIRATVPSRRRPDDEHIRGASGRRCRAGGAPICGPSTDLGRSMCGQDPRMARDRLHDRIALRAGRRRPMTHEKSVRTSGERRGNCGCKPPRHRSTVRSRCSGPGRAAGCCTHHAADRSVAPPRGLCCSASTTGLSPATGSRATRDPGVSPDRTHTGWRP